MTAVVGVVENGRVHFGADSQSTSGWDLTLMAQEKVFAVGPYVFGYSGLLRGGQLVRYAFDPPAPTTDLPRFMATTFVDALRKCLKDGGTAEKVNEREGGSPWVLVGVNGRIFTMGSDYSALESQESYAAIGSGSDLALGALYATEGQPVKRRLRTALEAAERFSAGVRGPFAYVSTKKV